MKNLYLLLIIFNVHFVSCQIEENEEDFCPQTYFKLNSAKEIICDVDRIKQLLEKYPVMCIQTRVSLFPEESSILAKKRIKTLRKLLVKSQVPIHRITFSSETHYYKPTIEYGCLMLPFISFEVISMEADCN